MPRTRSAAKKEKDTWKAVEEDMKGKKIDPRTGKVVTKKRKPKKPKASKPKAPKASKKK